MVQKFFCLLQSIFVFVKHRGVQNKARQSMYYTLIKFQTKKGMLACGNLPSFKDVCLCCPSFTFQILLSFVWFFLLLIFLVIIIVRSLLLDLWVKSAVALFAFPTLASDFQQTEKEKARGLSTLYYLTTINGSFQSEKKNLKFCRFRIK